jgi:branched-chain amino acid transport system permease protein
MCGTGLARRAFLSNMPANNRRGRGNDNRRCGLRPTPALTAGVRAWTFWIVAVALLVAAAIMTRFVVNQYVYFAGYVVLQYIVLATAWNILGGYTGYVNFGTAGFFALGAYTTVALTQTIAPPIGISILVGGLIAGLVGLGTGYLTLRLRGVFFSIATLAMSVVLQTFITNWDFVGGSRGAYIIRPRSVLFFANYVEFLFVLMALLAVGAVAIARLIERSWLGRGLAAIRDDEVAAICLGVPTLRLKLFATTISGFLMGVAGAPYPYYVTYLDPASGFNLAYAVNSIAMPLIGGTMTWAGPVVGAVLLGTAQQIATVTISSALNLLIVGVLLVVFVIVAPGGIVGLCQRLAGRRR